MNTHTRVAPQVDIVRRTSGPAQAISRHFCNDMDAGDTTTHKALRVVLNEKTNEAIKQMQKDSEELASLKKQLPILALGQKDINNCQTGQYLEEVHYHNYKHYLFQGKISHGIYKWRVDPGTDENLNLEQMMDRGLCHYPCPRYGCDGKHDHCPFYYDVCGLYYLAKGLHCWDATGWLHVDVNEFDIIWKEEPTSLSRGQLKEVQCKCCGKVLPEADIIDHIYDYQHLIWKCPHLKA